MATMKAPLPSKPMVWLLLPLAILAGAAVTAWGYPGLVLVWVALFYCAVKYPLFPFTGPKVAGRETPSGPGEIAERVSYTYWQNVKSGLWGGFLAPGWPPLTGWIAAVAGCSLLFFLPTDGAFVPLEWLASVPSIPVGAAVLPENLSGAVNTVAALLVVTALMGATRNKDAEDPYPGVRFDTVISMWKARLLRPVFLQGVPVLLGGLTGWVVFSTYPVWRFWASPAAGPLLVAVLAGLMVCFWLISFTIKSTALASWRSAKAHRAEWASRWELVSNIKAENRPRFVSRRFVSGGFTVDRFHSATLPASEFLNQTLAISNSIGQGMKAVLLNVPDVDASTREPIPGSISVREFEIATFATNVELPDVTDPSTPLETVQMMAHLAMISAGEAAKTMLRSPFGDLVRLTRGPEPVQVSIWTGAPKGAMSELVLSVAAGPLRVLGKVVRALKLDGVLARIAGKVMEAKAARVAKRAEKLAGEGQGAPVGDGGVPDVAGFPPASGRPVPDDGTEQDGEAQEPPVGPQLWALPMLPNPGGLGANTLREYGAAEAFAAAVGAPTAFDHRANGSQGVFVFGPVHDLDQVEILDDAAQEVLDKTGRPITAEVIEQAMEEDRLNGIWGQAHKDFSVNPPVPQWATKRSGKVSSTVNNRRVESEITYMGFVGRNSFSVDDLFKAEDKIRAANQAIGFAALIGFLPPTGRPGERHASAVTMLTSRTEVASGPQDLFPPERMPIRMEPNPWQWVLAARVSQAFLAAKLHRPEVISVNPMTTSGSRRHIWEMKVRLYGGDTLDQVRSASAKMGSVWNCTWVRVEEGEGETCTIIAGENPDLPSVTLRDPRRSEMRLQSVAWAQTFLDSGLRGNNGQMPVLKSVDRIPRNQEVKLLTFDLEGTGLTLSSFRVRVEKLQTNSAQGYVEPMALKGTTTQIVLRTSKDYPMPSSKENDFDFIFGDESKGMAFASDIEGMPVEMIPKRDTHLMVVGGSGSGKSVILQDLMCSAAAKIWEVHIADPTKGAADFGFMIPYASSFTVTYEDTAAAMKGIYAEVRRRVKLNAEYKAGNIFELPEELGIRPIAVFLDEFTSMLEQEKAPAPNGEIEVDMEIQAIKVLNGAKTSIGSLVGKIVREARSAGVVLIVAGQKLDAKTLTQLPGGTVFKTNLSRLIAGKTNYGDLAAALKNPSAAPNLGEHVPAGRAVFESKEKLPEIVQCWFVGDTQEVMAEKLAAHREPVDESKRMDLSLFRPGSKDVDEILEGQQDAFSAEGVLNERSAKVEVFEMGLDELGLGDLSFDDADGADGGIVAFDSGVDVDAGDGAVDDVFVANPDAPVVDGLAYGDDEGAAGAVGLDLSGVDEVLAVQESEAAVSMDLEGVFDGVETQEDPSETLDLESWMETPPLEELEPGLGGVSRIAGPADAVVPVGVDPWEAHGGMWEAATPADPDDGVPASMVEEGDESLRGAVDDSWGAAGDVTPSPAGFVEGGGVSVDDGAAVDVDTPGTEAPGEVSGPAPDAPAGATPWGGGPTGRPPVWDPSLGLTRGQLFELQNRQRSTTTEGPVWN